MGSLMGRTTRPAMVTSVASRVMAPTARIVMAVVPWSVIAVLFGVEEEVVTGFAIGELEFSLP